MRSTSFVLLSFLACATALSGSAFAQAPSAPLEQHAAQKGVPVGHFFHWNIHERASNDPAMRNHRELALRFEAGHHSHLRAHKMKQEDREAHAAFANRGHTRRVAIRKGAR